MPLMSDLIQGPNKFGTEILVRKSVYRPNNNIKINLNENCCISIL